MNAFLDIAMRPTVVLLIGLAAAGTLCRHSAAIRHAVLAAAVVAALATGPASLLMPGWDVAWPAIRQPVVSIDFVDAAGEPSSHVPAGGAGWDLSSVARALWLGGIAVLTTLLLVATVRLVLATVRAGPVAARWQTMADDVAAEMGLRRRVRVRQARSRRGPAAWGVLRSVVLLPMGADGWTDERARMVLRHELAHIDRGDWIVQMASDLLCVVWWFNPFAWIARTELRRLGELACDDAVLAGPFEAGRYAGELVAIARELRSPMSSVAVSMARPSTLERRVTAMLAPDLDRRPATRRLQIASAAAALVVLLPLAALRLNAQGGSGVLGVHVYDPSGAVLPGVTISLNHDGQSIRSGSTDASGRVVFEGVGAGDYTLEASLVGFRTLQAPVTLATPADWRRAVTLQVGELSETVSVKARRRSSLVPAPAGVAEPLRVGGNIRVPKKLNDVRPVYPASMSDAGLEGVVPMEALIGLDGSVVSVRVLSAQVHPEFAQSAEDAVRQWLFSPTLLNGQPVEVRMTVTVRFTFEN